MLNTIRLFILAFTCLTSNVSLSHDANVATFQIRQIGEQQWVYEVMTPLSNIDKSLRTVQSNLPKADPKNTEYKKKVVEYIKQGFNVKATGTNDNGITFNAEKLSLSKGRIKLEPHLSVIIFKINGMPKKVSKLDYTITNMSENLVHNNIFRIIQGKKHKHFLLNKQNSFSGSINDFLKNLKADSIRSKNTIKTVVDKE